LLKKQQGNKQEQIYIKFSHNNKLAKRDAAADPTAPTGAAVARYDGGAPDLNRRRRHRLRPQKESEGEGEKKTLRFLVWSPESNLVLRARIAGCRRVAMYRFQDSSQEQLRCDCLEQR